MDQRFSYYTDLGGVTLSDGSGTWVHALPLGTYQHPAHGELSFSRDRIKRFASSIKSRVLGIDPDIDYDHKKDPTKGNKAAGWVKDAEDRENGLWLLVEWTSAAKEAIANKEYRYFSTEYVDEMVDATGQKLVDVVRGGGLTNRPFMKNLIPINLSELDAEATPPTKENKMDPKKLRELLGLAEDATDADVESAIAAKSKKVDLSKAEVTVGDDGTIKVTHPDTEGTVEHKVEAPKVEDKGDKTEPSEAEIAELAKTQPALAAMLTETLESNKKLNEDFKTMVASQRLSDTTVQLSEVGDTKRVLSPAVQSELAPLLVRLPKELSDQFVDALNKVVSAEGIVQLGETTGGGRKRENGGESYNPVKQFMDKVNELKKDDDKLSTREAIQLTAEEDPDLFADYRSAVADGVQLTD